MQGAFSRSQRPSKVSTEDNDPMEFVCPVCLEIFDCPMITECGHIFCNQCLQECLRPQKPVCAVCRAALEKWKKEINLEKLIRSSSRPCKGCGVKVMLPDMKDHTEKCSKYQDYIQESMKNIVKIKPNAVSSEPNRYTFTCPYCSQQNFDQEGLVQHCTSQHARDPRQVVCPICASMPWGDPNYKSADFFQHIRMRHTFTYDTFVDYSTDEQAMIAAAIERSLLDK